MTEIKEKSIIVSSPVNHTKYGENIIVLVLAFGATIALLFFGFSHQPYTEFWLIILGLLPLGIGLIYIIKVLRLSTIEITETTVCLKSRIGEIIVFDRKDIISFHEKMISIETEDGVDEWSELFFFTNQEYLMISSRINPDYKKIKLILIKDLPDFFNDSIYERKEEIKRKKTLSIRLFALGVLCISFPALNLVYIKYMASDIRYDQLIEIKGTLKKYPEVLRENDDKKEEIGFDIELKEYPDFKFKLYKDYFNINSYDKFGEDLFINKELKLSISLDEYKKKFSEELPIKFNDRYFHFNNILVFGAKYDDIELNRIKYKPAIYSAKLELSSIMYVAIALCVISLYWGVQRWREYKGLLMEEK